MHYFLALIALLLIPTISRCQPPDSLWAQAYGGVEDEYCPSFLHIPGEGFLLAGGTESYGSVDPSFWIIRTNESGDSLWSRVYEGYESASRWVCTERTSDGCFLIAGSANFNEESSEDFWLIKVNENGDSLWSRTYGGNAVDWCNSIIETSDGCYILAGETRSLENWYYDFWMIKTSADGDSLWSRTYGGIGTEQYPSVIETSDGGFALGGLTTSYGTGGYDFWLVKTDADGDSLWTRTYGGAGHEYCFSIKQTSDEGYILVGNTNSSGATYRDGWVVRTDADGEIIWSRMFDKGYYDYFKAVQQTADGGFIVAGHFIGPGNVDQDGWLVRLNPEGDTLWTQDFRGIYDDAFLDMLIMPDGSYAVAGITQSIDDYHGDFLLYKTGPENTPAVESKPPILPQNFTLSAYPNPFNSTTIISFTLPAPQRATVTVYNLAGQTINALINEHLDHGKHNLSFQAWNLPTGIYFATLRTQSTTVTKKLFLLR